MLLFGGCNPVHHYPYMHVDMMGPAIRMPKAHIYSLHMVFPVRNRDVPKIKMAMSTSDDGTKGCFDWTSDRLRAVFICGIAQVSARTASHKRHNTPGKPLIHASHYYLQSTSVVTCRWRIPETEMELVLVARAAITPLHGHTVLGHSLLRLQAMAPHLSLINNGLQQQQLLEQC